MFLNSKQWREFQEKTGRKTFDIGENGYAIKMELPLGKSYLYSPSPDAMKYLDEIKKIAKKEGVVFFKYEPMIRLEREIRNSNAEDSESKESLLSFASDAGIKRSAQFEIRNLREFGFQNAVKELQPQRTIIIDTTKNEDQILADMHSKTRYNIRLAERKGVEIKLSEDKKKDFDKFWDLMQKTINRDGFSAHHKDYYRKLLDVEGVELFFAYLRRARLPDGQDFGRQANKDEKPVASAIIIFHEGRATYLHGASDHDFRKFMAPHLMHWEIIKYAKENGMKEYDLWGIDEMRWPGITRFKKGFLSSEALAKGDGGKEVDYVGSYDLPLQKLWYFIYKLKNKA